MSTVTVLDYSERPADEIAEIIDFVFDRSSEITRSLTIRLVAGFGGGYAADRTRHRFPKWAKRSRYAIKCSVLGDNHATYGHARICGHATIRRFAGGEFDRLYDEGVRKVGRWPLYRVHDWREWLVHLLAHEMMHVIQYDRDRRSHSEVHCEEHAARLLAEYQALRGRAALAILQVER